MGTAPCAVLAESWTRRRGGASDAKFECTRPCVVLGLVDAVRDDDAKTVRNLASQVVSRCAAQEAALPENCSCRNSQKSEFSRCQIFNRCLLLYPEQMMFAAFRVKQ